MTAAIAHTTVTATPIQAVCLLRTGRFATTCSSRRPGNPWKRVLDVCLQGATLRAVRHPRERPIGARAQEALPDEGIQHGFADCVLSRPRDSAAGYRHGYPSRCTRRCPAVRRLFWGANQTTIRAHLRLISGARSIPGRATIGRDQKMMVLPLALANLPVPPVNVVDSSNSSFPPSAEMTPFVNVPARMSPVADVTLKIPNQSRNRTNDDSHHTASGRGA